MAQLLKGIGKQIQIGVAKETTRGTAPSAATYWLQTEDWDLTDRWKNSIDAQSYGVIEDSVGQTRVKNWSEGTVKMAMGGTTSAVLFYSLFGSLAATVHAGETKVFDQAVTVAQSVQHQSLSFFVHDPIPTASGVTADHVHKNAVVTKMDIDYTLGDFVKATVGLKALKGSTAAVAYTPAITLEDLFVPQYLTFKVASTYSTLSSGTTIKLKSAKITIDGNSEDDDVLGSTDPRDFVNKEFSIEGTVEAIWQSQSDFMSNALAGTVQACRFDLVNSDRTYGVAATSPEIKIDLAKCVFTAIDLPITIKDIVYQTVHFKAHYSSTDALMAKVTVTNTVTSY